MSLNRNQWKYLAVAAMLLDHIAYLFLPGNTALYYVFRTLGRLTAPTMCYLLAEGYQYTSSKGKYALRLLLFALLSQIPFSLAVYGKIDLTQWNVGLTLLLSFLALWFWDNGPIPANKPLMIGALVLLSYFGDWGVLAPLMVLIFYSNRGNQKELIRKYSILAAAIVGIGIVYYRSLALPWYQELWQAGMFLFVPFLLWYNGKQGSRRAVHKWFFYLFYPAHLLALAYIAGL